METFEFIQNKSLRESIPMGRDNLIKTKIKDWFNKYDIKEDQYHINDDNTIDVYGDFVFINKDVMEFPDFIQFNNISGGFFVEGNQWINIKGFPKVIHGSLNILMKKNPAREKLEKEIKNNIKIYGNLWI